MGRMRTVGSWFTTYLLIVLVVEVSNSDSTATPLDTASEIALASMDSRKYIMSRRGGGIANLQSVNMKNGDLSIEQADSMGVYKVNCTHQVGIATATEVGLSEDRYAIRVVIAADGAAALAPATDTVCSYWRVVNASGNAIPFSRKPLASDLAIKNLYKHVPDIDDLLWAEYNIVKDQVADVTPMAELDTQRNQLVSHLSLISPTTEQAAAIPNLVKEIIATSQAANRIVWIKITDVAFLIGEPHGVDYAAIGSLSTNRVALSETLLCAQVNFERMKKRHDSVNDGALLVAAYSVANMFRTGLYESYEHKEYYTIRVNPVAGQPTQFRIATIRRPAGAGNPEGLTVGSVLDLAGIKVKQNVVELANSCVVGSGLMHYLFNHTTGGTVLTGTLLTTLSMYQLITPDMAHEMQTEITSVMYEALHPTNKRAIANIFFKNTGVTTSGRCVSAPRFERFQLDSFMMIRSNPYPAGSHKAFICLSALKRVLQAGLGPFLPWADQMSACIQTCKEVLNSGARAHIGASYYTGEPPKAQPASIDMYLPELAQFLHTFSKGDSLSMSPHMADEIAKRSNMNWQNLLKELKAKDVSATNVEVVRTFLATSGAVHFTFNPDDQSTWAKAVGDASNALATISNVFN